MTKIEFKERSTVLIDDQLHQISFSEGFGPTNEYKIVPYVFTDEKSKSSDGCVFEIEPRGSTRMMRITDADFTCQRIAIKGSGWFLGVNPDGEVVEYKLNSNSKQNPEIELTKGWVDCWIADDKGMEVADVSTPPFRPEMEEEIYLNDPSLPVEFWNFYRKLKQIK